jgi:hypothetical protein
MHAEMVETFKQTFGDNAKAPKPAFTAAGTMLKIRKQQGENAYEQAMSNMISRAQNKYYGYSKATKTAKVPRTAKAAKPARYNTGGIVQTIRMATTRKNVIRSLEEILAALRAENEAEGVAPPAQGEPVAPRPVTAPRPRKSAKRVQIKSKSKKKSASRSPPKLASKSRSASRSKSGSRNRLATLKAPSPAPAKKAAAGQQAISVARAALASQAGMKIPQKIAAPFAKWAKGKVEEEVQAKQVELVAALKAREGRNDNSIAINLGLKTQENVEKRRQQVLRNQARMAAAKKAAAAAKE